MFFLELSCIYCCMIYSYDTVSSSFFVMHAPPIRTRRHNICARQTKGNTSMGGPRGTQTNRVQATRPLDGLVGVSTLSSKGLHNQDQPGGNLQKDSPPLTEDTQAEGVDTQQFTNDDGEIRPGSPVMD